MSKNKLNALVLEKTEAFYFKIKNKLSNTVEEAEGETEEPNNKFAKNHNLSCA